MHRAQPIRDEGVYNLAPAGSRLDPRGASDRVHLDLTVVQGQPCPKIGQSQREMTGRLRRHPQLAAAGIGHHGL